MNHLQKNGKQNRSMIMMKLHHCGSIFMVIREPCLIIIGDMNNVMISDQIGIEL